MRGLDLVLQKGKGHDRQEEGYIKKVEEIRNSYIQET